MTQHESNVREAEQMLNRIAERAGGDRASVFLDIIIGLVFSELGQRRRDLPASKLRKYATPQQLLNEIAATYQTEAPALKSDEDPNEIPF